MNSYHGVPNNPFANGFVYTPYNPVHISGNLHVITSNNTSTVPIQGIGGHCVTNLQGNLVTVESLTDPELISCLLAIERDYINTVVGVHKMFKTPSWLLFPAASYRLSRMNPNEHPEYGSYSDLVDECFLRNLVPPKFASFVP